MKLYSYSLLHYVFITLYIVLFFVFIDLDQCSLNNLCFLVSLFYCIVFYSLVSLCILLCNFVRLYNTLVRSVCFKLAIEIKVPCLYAISLLIPTKCLLTPERKIKSVVHFAPLI